MHAGDAHGSQAWLVTPASSGCPSFASECAGGRVQLKEIIQSLTSRSLQLYNDGENHKSQGMSNFRDTFKMKLSSQAYKTTFLYLRQKRQSGINFFFFCDRANPICFFNCWLRNQFYKAVPCKYLLFICLWRAAGIPSNWERRVRPGCNEELPGSVQTLWLALFVSKK